MPYRWTLTNLKTLDYEVLQNDPVNWSEATFTINRSETFKGMNPQFISPVKFHCAGGGKNFIDAVYESEFIDGRLDVLIEYDCDGSGTYETLYNGLINLASYQTEGDYTICNIEQSDLMTKITMRDDISVNMQANKSIGDLPITPATVQTMLMPPMMITFYNEWIVEDGYALQKNITVRNDRVYELYMTPTMGLTKGDIDTAFPLVEALDDTAWSNGHVGQFERTVLIDPLLTANETGVNYPITINYDVDISGVFFDEITDGPNRSNQNWYLRLIKGRIDIDDTNSIDEIFIKSFGGYSSSPFSFPVAFKEQGTFQLYYGESVWIYLQYVNNQSGSYTNTIKFTFNRSHVRLTSPTIYNATDAKAILVHEAFNQVVDAIADSDGNFKSEFYGRTDSSKQSYSKNGCGGLVAITNGLNIRRFADKPLYASLKELFTNFDALHNIGLGIVEGQVRVEELSFWFDNTTRILTLPYVNTYKLKADERRVYNKIEIGYNTWESEFKGGLDEPNTKHEYATVVASAKNTYAKMSGYISSSYAIELTRRKNIVVLPTEDWRYDNDNFLIAARTGCFTAYCEFISPDKIKVFGAFTNTFKVNDVISITGSSDNDTPAGIVTHVLTGDKNTQPTSGYGAGANIITLTMAGPIYTEAPTVDICNLTQPTIRPELLYDGFNSATNMLASTTAYNLRLTPKRMLLAHLNVITAGLQKIKGFIKFVKGEGNTALVSTKKNIDCAEDFDGQPLGEADSIEWSDDRAANIRPLWFPEVYSFEYPLTYEQFKTIKANPYGYVEFYRFEDDKKAGYILNMEYQLKTGMTKFELLRMFAPEAVGDEDGNYVGDEDGMIVGLTPLRG